MTAIFSFDETDEHIPPRARRDTASSFSSFDDRWQQNSSEPTEIDIQPRVRHFGSPWDHYNSIAEEDELPSRTGTPPIPIPNGHTSPHLASTAGSVKVDFEEDFVAAQVVQDSKCMNRKMIPSDFEQVRVLGKGGYGTVLLVRHKESGKLFAQKQLKKASLFVQTKIVGIFLSVARLMKNIQSLRGRFLRRSKTPSSSNYSTHFKIQINYISSWRYLKGLRGS
jgi:hypothetical protein